MVDLQSYRRKTRRKTIDGVEYRKVFYINDLGSTDEWYEKYDLSQRKWVVIQPSLAVQIAFEIFGGRI